MFIFCGCVFVLHFLLWMVLYLGHQLSLLPCNWRRCLLMGSRLALESKTQHPCSALRQWKHASYIYNYTTNLTRNNRSCASVLVEITESCQVNLELRIMHIFTHLFLISLVFMVACAASTNRCQSGITENIHIKRWMIHELNAAATG